MFCCSAAYIARIGAPSSKAGEIRSIGAFVPAEEYGADIEREVIGPAPRAEQLQGYAYPDAGRREAGKPGSRIEGGAPILGNH